MVISVCFVLLMLFMASLYDFFIAAAEKTYADEK